MSSPLKISSLSCGLVHSSFTPSLPPPNRMEKLKFGIPLGLVCRQHNDLPAPLLVMILKLHKEAPLMKDVFRVPGKEAHVKELVNFLEDGRLVNVDHYSSYTIASVIKRFIRELPAGVFGREGERRLFQVINWNDNDRKHEEIHMLLTSLPFIWQHLLVLLFGTFRAMATSSESFMTSEAIGLSVGPSFFRTCVQSGQLPNMDDVLRFKVASNIMKYLIDNFGVTDLFGRYNYEYYLRMSGREPNAEKFFGCDYPRESYRPIASSVWLAEHHNQQNPSNQTKEPKPKKLSQNPGYVDLKPGRKSVDRRTPSKKKPSIRRSNSNPSLSLIEPDFDFYSIL